ncbi:hypothetical protein PENSTE_c046G08734 [Penicillium steckii]|uniref:CSC1/OSCA1-like 7TM region domain-containing protein n=1 Tax=Penicillium steckii TaxID=303698 RepID=A0A1V6SI82_9EURO|nr:hypothetical protein PENSTE_c046G08734 [Penicillium steckii]
MTLVAIVVFGETLAPAAVKVAPEALKSPSSTPILLAPEFAKGSNFCIQYFILDGIAKSSLLLLGTESYIRSRLKSLFDDTPRKIKRRRSKRYNVNWGEVFPETTIFGVAAITYSCVAPLVLGFACPGLCLYYLSRRYKIRNLPVDSVDTHGRAYHVSLQQILAACYLLIVFLIILFAFASDGDATYTGPVCLLAVLLVLCIVYHSLLNRVLKFFGHFTSGDLIRYDIPAKSSYNPLTRIMSRCVFAWMKKFQRVENNAKDDCEITTSIDAEWEKYFPPCMIAEMPTLWVPRDSRGWSRRVVEESLYLESLW